MGNEVARITQELEDCSQRLTLAIEEYTDSCRAAAEARTDYDVKWAQNLLKAIGKTVSEREAEVTIICEAAMREARIAEGLRDAYKERVRALEAILNSIQTRASFLKAEMHLTNRSY